MSCGTHMAASTSRIGDCAVYSGICIPQSVYSRSKTTVSGRLEWLLSRRQAQGLLEVCGIDTIVRRSCSTTA